ncbi:MAG: carboxypeptidase-like regulatory domain-containing protein [Bacteroidetes bacterium]|nr:carboxypeptidase-like regulatory domain-containing protein [Bacteroidota bacterium]
MGKVTDFETKEPLPFVTVAFIGGKFGSTIGATTDFEGNYALDTRLATDSIVISYVGYITVTKKVEKNKFQNIDIELKKNSYTLSEVQITPGENPAEVILKKIIANKDKNRRENIDALQYESYNKIEFDANNLTEEYRKKRVFKHFQFVFDNVDTSTINGKSYLPLILIENISDVYFRKEPKSQKEIIKANRISGMKNESITQFLGDMYQNINVYDNYIELFQRNFVSPIANFGLGFYKYYLVDSAYIGNKWCYQIMFKPRRKQELTFTGSFWANDSTFAIKKIDMRVVDDANINFINDLVAVQEFDLFENKYWLLTKDHLVIDFNIINNTKTVLGFFGRKTTTYRNFVYNKPKDEEFYKTPTDITIADGSFEKSKEYWAGARHDSLTKNEEAIYKMVDSVKTVPAFKTYLDIVKILTTGYKLWGKVEIGPYMSIYSFNSIEGNRFRLGGRTSNSFSKKLMLSGHVAYGTKDKTYKYAGGFVYMLSKSPRRSFGASYKSDVEQLGESQNALSEDYLLAALFRKSPSGKLSMVTEAKGFYEHEWFTGFSNTINLIHRDIYPIGDTKFEFFNEGQRELQNSITTSEVRLDLRFAYREKYVMGEFERVSMGTKHPVVKIQYTYGIKNLFNSDYEFQKVQFAISQWVNVSSFGYLKYNIQAGRIFGKLPYPLLKLHEGNETYFFDEEAYNMMNLFEFASDKYVSAHLTYHFEGLLFNRIPLLRKLRWREVVLLKGVVGSLDERNRTYSTFPSTLSAVGKPYFETGVGIENIFNFFRVDALWRLSYLDHPNTSPFAIRANISVLF